MKSGPQAEHSLAAADLEHRLVVEIYIAEQLPAKRAKSKPWFQRPIFLPISLRRSAADSVAEPAGTAWYVVDMRSTPFKMFTAKRWAPGLRNRVASGP